MQKSRGSDSEFELPVVSRVICTLLRGSEKYYATCKIFARITSKTIE